VSNLASLFSGAPFIVEKKPPASIFPFEFKNLVQDKIYKLIQYKFAEYLNLLYIIDVPEDQIKKLHGSDLVELSEQVTFLVLKREWQKVWFRNKY
jgi:hypothetical protein